METTSDAVRDRAIRLFSYLKDLSELRTTTVRTIDSYERIIWLADIPRFPGCFTAAWFDESARDREEVWVEIQKPPVPQEAPAPPVELTNWLEALQIANSSLDFPPLRDSIEQYQEFEETKREDAGQDDPDATILLSNHPDVVERWERYIEEDWMPWADDDRLRRAMQAAYAELFAIYQRQQRLGEQFEIVLALGLLNWKTSSGQVVRRHILTAQTSILFTSEDGTLTVGPAGEGAKLLVEQDMLEPEERPDATEQNAVAALVDEFGDDLWQAQKIDSLLSAWVHAVSFNGRYDREFGPSSTITTDPVVRFSPALILRRRTERSIIRTFQDIIELLESGTPIPPGVKGLVDVIDGSPFGREQIEGQQAPGRPVDDIYFPLPANAEQAEIVERLGTRQGVLVQGPPGTGKSHTIANLVSHLLATGQRVLVTSHTARALQVLHEKLPTEIAPLCVSLLGDDRIALQDLEDSVVGITERFNYWDTRQSAIEISQLEKELDARRRGEALALDNLLKIREADVRVHSLGFGGYSGTSETLARQVASEADRFGWIQVRPSESQPPPLNNFQAVSLLHLLRDLSAERESELVKAFPRSAELITPDEFEALVQRERDLETRARSTNLRVQDILADVLARAGEARLTQVRDDLADIERDLRQLIQGSESWVTLAVTQVLLGNSGAWRQLRDTTFKHLSSIDTDRTASHERQVMGTEGRPHEGLHADAQNLLNHLASGKGLGFGPFRPEPVKRGQYLLESVFVDGKRCDNPQTLRDLIGWLDYRNRVNQLRQHWTAHADFIGESPEITVARLRDRQLKLQHVLRTGEQVAELRRAYSDVPGMSDVTLSNATEMREFSRVLDAALWSIEMKAVRQPLNRLTNEVTKFSSLASAHGVVEKLDRAVSNRQSIEYSNAIETVRGLEHARLQLAERHELMKRLHRGALAIAGELATSFMQPEWDERLGSFTAAWDWARADLWLRNSQDGGELERQTKNLQSHRDQIRITMGKLAAEKAWQHTFQRMTEKERQRLMAWMKAMRRIGKGTGKYAAQHRREAREHMEHCRSAIPAWIMPVYRVAESVRPGKDAFDVVIVDEASQSGPEALFLQYIAKQIVVVGDDKQISPEFVGINREAVEALRALHIPDLDFKDALGVDNSFFDQADIRFGGRIRLKEHFRCMPEIIQFSNNLAYRAEPLIPLRQYNADRLPPIRTVHVPDGYPKGDARNVVNPPEAVALVAQIKSCCEDPAYDSKSMGVISLQGEAQAREIERLLLDEIGPEEIERRGLVCGNAYAFQGDERDIIFLSLVAARSENHRIGPLAGARDVQRFNVAASRARDQFWLFHSATLDDLSPTCMRYQLLSYCLNPRVELIPPNIKIRESSELQEPFDSLFEQQVFQRIQERGYRVRPQVDVAGYRIDLVVEGMDGRLAVECDGDKWHGPERHERDMGRQRDLERYGWQFWRVRGSTYFRNPDEALEGLWKTLDELKIQPWSAGEEVPLEAADQEPAVLEPDGRDAVSTSVTAIDLPTSAAPPPEAEAPWDILTPYEAWDERPLPDPLSASMTPVLDSLLEIIAAEGPVQCRRVYRKYAASAGISGSSPVLRSVLNKTLYRGVQLNLLELRDETGDPGQIDKFARLTEGPEVSVRERGDRTLEEIPPSEIAAAMTSLARHQRRALPAEAEDVFGDLLREYGLDRDRNDEIQTRVLNRALAFLTVRHENGHAPVIALELVLGD